MELPVTTLDADPPCARCHHSPDWHRHDDSDNVSPVDPRCTFRCLGYDCTTPGPVPPGGRACDCPDYVQPGHARGAVTPAEVACELTGTVLDPTPAIDYCSICGLRRDGPGWAGCKAHTRSTTEGEQP
jgi:hypothetical protein